MFASSFFVLALPLLALAFDYNGHHSRRRHSQVRKLSSRTDGAEFTYYAPGLGACGGVNGENDFIVALSAASWDGGSHCGEQVDITVNGKTATATIVDQCPGCAANHMDLTPGLFKYFGDLGAGVLHGSFSSGAEKKAQEEKKKKEEEEAKKKQEEEAKKKQEEEEAKKKAEEEAKKKQEEEEAKKKEEEDAKKKAEQDAASKSSAEAAAKTSSSSASSSSASQTSSSVPAATTTAASSGDALAQANLLILQMAGMAAYGYQA